MKPHLLARLVHQPIALDHLLMELTENQLRHHPTPAKWSVFENIAHLGRYQEVFLARMHTVLDREKPRFERYVADEDPGFAHWTARSLETALRDWRQERQTILAFVRQLTDDQLQRVGLHPAYGAMTIEGWTEFFLLHEAHHFLTILQLTGQLRGPDQVLG